MRPRLGQLKLCLCRLHLSLFLLPCFSWNMLFGKLQSTSRCRSISLHFPYSGNSAWFQLSGTRHTLFVHLTHHLLQQKYKNNVYMRWKHLPQTSAHLLLAQPAPAHVISNLLTIWEQKCACLPAITSSFTSSWWPVPTWLSRLAELRGWLEKIISLKMMHCWKALEASWAFLHV